MPSNGGGRVASEVKTRVQENAFLCPAEQTKRLLATGECWDVCWLSVPPFFSPSILTALPSRSSTIQKNDKYELEWKETDGLGLSGTNHPTAGNEAVVVFRLRAPAPDPPTSGPPRRLSRSAPLAPSGAFVTTESPYDPGPSRPATPASGMKGVADQQPGEGPFDDEA